MRRIDMRLADLKARQEAGTYTLCPRCGRDTMRPDLYTNALSRLADIMICDDCGTDEAKLAFMRSPGTIYSWAGLQPERPESDFKALAGAVVWERLRTEQADTLFRLYRQHLNGRADEETRYDAFESLPGLIQIWTEPFHLRYQAADGEVLVRFESTPTGTEMTADLVSG